MATKKITKVLYQITLELEDHDTNLEDLGAKIAGRAATIQGVSANSTEYELIYADRIEEI